MITRRFADYMHFGEFPFELSAVISKCDFVISDTILGNIKSFHSAKFRFTFTHVYIHEPLNLKNKPTTFFIGFTIPYYIYKNI